MNWRKFYFTKKQKVVDGYNSCKIAFKNCLSIKNVNKPLIGQFEKVELTPKKYIKEIRDMDGVEFESGSQLNPLENFSFGEKIKVTGKTKGKGFSGVIKKYGFSRGGMSHGSGYPHRRIGSLCFGRGNGQKIVKGKKIPGRMGNKKVTKVAYVEKIDKENSLIYLRGSIPGPNKSVLVFKKNFNVN